MAVSAVGLKLMQRGYYQEKWNFVRKIYQVI